MAGTSCVFGISTPEGRIDTRGVKWVILWQAGFCNWPVYHWECITDVPIIMFAYVGRNSPWKKRGTHMKRGVTYHHDAELFWTFHDLVCQDEPGLSYHHTFSLPAYKSDVTFWWRCGGRTSTFVWPGQPIWTASRSPFYHAKCHEPVYTPACYCEYQYTSATGLSSYQQWCISFMPTRSYYATRMTMWYAQYDIWTLPPPRCGALDLWLQA